MTAKTAQGHDEVWRLAAWLMARRPEYLDLPQQVRGQLIQDIRFMLLMLGDDELLSGVGDRGAAYVRYERDCADLGHVAFEPNWADVAKST